MKIFYIFEIAFEFPVRMGLNNEAPVAVSLIEAFNGLVYHPSVVDKVLFLEPIDEKVIGVVVEPYFHAETYKKVLIFAVLLCLVIALKIILDPIFPLAFGAAFKKIASEMIGKDDAGVPAFDVPVCHIRRVQPPAGAHLFRVHMKVIFVFHKRYPFHCIVPCNFYALEIPLNAL